MNVLFLGTIDDKSIEYPYGDSSSLTSISDSLLFNHLLYSDTTNTPLLLEEGFLMASSGAVASGDQRDLLVNAIDNGLVKVASRHGNLKEYAKERRSLQHEAPSKDQIGNAYIENLQNSCENSKAFIKYPVKDVDYLTYSQYRKLYSSDKFKALFAGYEMDLPERFLKCYEQFYYTGNAGERWTARSAWEKTVTTVFQGDVHNCIRHALMCEANRERQIIRGAAFAEENNIGVQVETGFSKEAHELTVLQADTDTEVNEHKSALKGKRIPRVSLYALREGADKLFQALGDKGSFLYDKKYDFLRAQEKLDKDWTDDNLMDFESASQAYEDKIYRTLDKKPVEDWTTAMVVSTALIAEVVNPTDSLLRKYWKQKKQKENDRRFYDSKMSRRAFFHSGSIATISAVAFLNTTGVPFVTKGVRAARSQVFDDSSDIYSLQTDNNQLFHQTVSINKAAAAKFFE